MVIGGLHFKEGEYEKRCAVKFWSIICAIDILQACEREGRKIN